MAIEQFGAVISLKFLDSNAVGKYLSELERLQAINSQQARKIGESFKQAAAGELPLEEALTRLKTALSQAGVGAQGINAVTKAFTQAESGTRALAGDIQGLNREFERLATKQKTAALEQKELNSLMRMFGQVSAGQLGALGRTGTSGAVAQSVVAGRVIPPNNLEALSAKQRATEAQQYLRQGFSQTQTAKGMEVSRTAIAKALKEEKIEAEGSARAENRRRTATERLARITEAYSRTPAGQAAAQRAADEELNRVTREQAAARRHDAEQTRQRTEAAQAAGAGGLVDEKGRTSYLGTQGDMEAADDRAASAIRKATNDRIAAGRAVDAAELKLKQAIETEAKTHDAWITRYQDANKGLDRAQKSYNTALDAEAKAHEAAASQTQASITGGVPGAAVGRTPAQAAAEAAKQRAVAQATAQVERATAESTAADLHLHQSKIHQADVVRKSYFDESLRNADLNAANRQVVAAERDAAAATERLARTRTQAATTAAAPAAAGGGYGSGLLGSFATGFRGNTDVPVAQQLGQTARFSVYYGAMYKVITAITAVFAATLTEAIAFQSAVTELNIATGKSTEANSELASRLGDIASQTGQSPSEGVLTGARAVGLFGLNDASSDIQALAAESSARTSAMVLLGNDARSFQETQADVAAIAQSFGTGYAGQSQIVDLDAFMAAQYGVKQGSTLQPVAESGAVAQQAGFSLEEVVAISANLQSRTGQSAATIGGLLNQIFTRGGEGNLAGIAGRFGVDTSGQDLHGVIEDLSKLYNTATQREKIQIASSFGRGRSQNVSAVLLQEFADIQAKAKDAKENAGGAAEKQFQERLHNVGGELNQLAGEFKEFAVELGKTGIITVLGGVVVGIRNFLAVINDGLSFFNALPGGIRATLGALGALVIALRLATVASQTEAAASAEAALADSVEAGASVRAAVASGAASTGFITMAGANGLLAARAGMGAAALGLLTNPAILATAAFLAMAHVWANNKKIEASLAGATTLENEFAKDGLPSAIDIRSQASATAAQAKEVKDAPSRFNIINSLGAANDASDAEAASLKKQSEYMTALAEATEKANNRLADTPQLFDFLDKQGLDDGLNKLRAAGAGAGEVFMQLSHQLLDAGAAARIAEHNFKPSLFAQELGASLPAMLARDLDRVNALENDKLTGNPYEKHAADWLEDDFIDLGWAQPKESERVPFSTLLKNAMPVDEQQTMIRDRIKSALSTYNVKAEGAIDDKKAAQLAQAAGEGLAELMLPEGTETQIKNLQDQIDKTLADSIMTQTADYRKSYADKSFSRAEAAVAAAAFLEAGQGILTGGRHSETDTAGATDIWRRTVNRIEQVAARRQGGAAGADADGRAQTYSNEAEGQLGNSLMEARRGLLASQVAGMEEVRKGLQQDADSRAEVIEIGHRYRDREIDRAVSMGEAGRDVLAGILELGGKSAQAAILSALDAQITIAKMAVRAELRAWRQAKRAADSSAAFMKALFPDTGKTDATDGSDPFTYGPWSDASDGSDLYLDGNKPPGPGPKPGKGSAARDNLRNLRSQQRQFDQAAAGIKDGFIEEEESRAQIAAARYAAGIATDDGVGAARAALVQAQADLSDAKADGTDSSAYWKAMKGVRDAQFALAQAEIDLATARGDANAARVGGQIAAAVAGLNAAQANLEHATPGTAAYYQALAGVYQAQDALATAHLQYQQNVAILGSDSTNPLIQAQIGLRFALKKLQDDQAAGKAPDVIAEDKVAVQAAQASAEQTAFSQRLEAVTTAEDLGRISHGAYIRYLEHEKTRLENIGHRSFQQQQQLNQIDGLLQSAAEEMQGQFNIGSIKLPTPYQVRRYIEQQTPHGAADRLSRPTVDQSTTTIQIDGADTRKIRQVLEQILGNSNRRANAPRRK